MAAVAPVHVIPCDMRSIIRHASATIAVACVCAPHANAQLTRRELIQIDGVRVIADANRYLSEPPITVTAGRATRSAGGVHDYYSEGDYWWPDLRHPDGKYIRRDEETNPENFVAHRVALIRLSQIDWPVRQPSLLFGGLALDEPKYVALWKTLNPEPTVGEIVRNYPVRQPGLWVGGP